MNKVYEIGELDKIEASGHCFFADYDKYNGNPLDPVKLCVLYPLLGYEKPNCEECIIKRIIVEVDE